MIMFEYRYCLNFGIQNISHDTDIKVCKDTELSDIGKKNSKISKQYLLYVIIDVT